MSAQTFKTLKTDYADVLYFHNLGGRDVDLARRSDGVFTWLLKQKKAGKCRFVGISGHNLPGRFQPFLETGEVDVILVTLNFADRFTYNFEERVLPLAREHNTGIVAMKVFGGPDPKTGSWGNPDAKPYVGEDNVELAIRYALSTPGV
ncbi:MAG: aldo/keto reductase, partial [Planctomycetota bacterium]|nr:aldo/keto reductase [Planctomycetota bacterium]